MTVTATNNGESPARGHHDASGIQAALARVPARYGAALIIDAGAMRANYRHFDQTAGGSTCAAVVKANAYGLGLERACHELSRVGCTVYFVATIDEGIILRKQLPRAVIYVLNGLFVGAERDYVAYGLRPVLCALEQIRTWSNCAKEHTARLPAAIHIDTGMSRLGLSATECEELASTPQVLRSCPIELVMSHLACADEPEHPMNDGQRRRFESATGKLAAHLPEAVRSLANSAGIWLGRDFHYDLVRPGVGLYGVNPLGTTNSPLSPVVSIHARLLQTRTLAPGDSVGYGASHLMKRASRIGTLALGYADGMSRHLSATDDHPGPVFWIGDHPVPLVGRVSMDQITVDLTDVPSHLSQPGTWIEIAGQRTRLEDLAQRAGTIGYEHLVQLGTRFHRQWAGMPAGTGT